MMSSGWVSNSNDAATPKLPPPPRSAQNRSGSSSAFDDAHLAVGGDHLDLGDVVDGQAVLAHQPAEAAAQRQPGDAGASRPPRRWSPARRRWWPGCTRSRSRRPAPGPGGGPDRRRRRASATGRSSARPRSRPGRPRCGRRRAPRSPGRSRARSSPRHARRRRCGSGRSAPGACRSDRCAPPGRRRSPHHRASTSEPLNASPTHPAPSRPSRRLLIRAPPAPGPTEG